MCSSAGVFANRRSTALRLLPPPHPEQHDDDRRSHPRLTSSELAVPTLVRIQRQPPVSLVNLSVGGALLEAPFQLRPGSRLTLDVLTSGHKVSVSLHLLRCFVSELKDGLRYQAACAFDRALALPMPLDGGAAHGERQRLLQVLESFQQNSVASEVTWRDARVGELLAWVVSASRRSEPPSLLATRIEAHLRELFPSLVICAKSPLPPRDPSTCSQFFDLEFRSHTPLSGSDRRFLRASAQLISLLTKPTSTPTEDKEAAEVIDSLSLPSEIAPCAIAHTTSEWMEMCQGPAPLSKSVYSADEDFLKMVTR